jgi:hypothetical protein
VIFLVIGCLAVLWASQANQEPIPFLRGKPQVKAGAQRANSHSKWGDYTYRVYSWKQNFEQARRAAERELPRLGYRWKSASSIEADWEAPGEKAVYMFAADTSKPPESFDDLVNVMPGPVDAEWTTVYVQEPADGSWLTIVRMSLEW